MPVAETFTFEDARGKRLDEFCRLDTLVTVIDAVRGRAAPPPHPPTPPPPTPTPTPAPRTHAVHTRRTHAPP